MVLSTAVLAALAFAGGQATLGDRVSKFGENLFAHIPRSGGPGDLVSPLSVYQCIGLLVPGSSGSTRSTLLKALQYQPNEESSFLSDVHDESVALAKPGSGLLMANAVWTRPGLALSSSYETTVTNSFMASATALVGLGSAGANQINDWVKQNTKGRISSLFNSLSASTEIVLTNAVAFDGTWVRPFDERNTKALTFHGSAGDLDVPTMSRTWGLQYAQTDHGQVAVLPYKEGESMWIGLPKPGDGPTGSMSDLFSNPTTYYARLDLRLPKFTYTCSYSLNGALEKMGLGEIFSHPDFSRMMAGGSPGRVSEVIQKTYIKVDEKGTQAAAATGTVIASAVMRQPAAIPFYVDHPFAFAIRDDKSGAVLFMGVVRDVKPS